MAAKKLTPTMEHQLVRFSESGLMRVLTYSPDEKTARALERRELIFQSGRDRSYLEFSYTTTGMVVVAQLQRERRQLLHAMWCRAQSPYNIYPFKSNDYEYRREWDMVEAGLPDLND